MAALFLPFGYPGYPQQAMLEHIKASEDYLKKIGVNAVSARPVVNLCNCEDAIRIMLSFRETGSKHSEISAA